MEHTINPTTLKTLRNKRNWTQAELADELHCTKDQVSRWERGISKRVSSHLRERLAKVFGVRWETLTEPFSEEEAEPYSRLRLKSQLNVRVPTFVRNALALVCRRYDVSQADVIGLAPLLFLISAEKSLRKREGAVDAIFEKAEAAEKDLESTSPHMAPRVVFLSGTYQEELDDEVKAIERRDVFNRHAPAYGDRDYCPYTNYLKSVAGDLIGEAAAVGEISPSDGDIPKYEIALDTFAELTGFSGNSDREKQARNYVFEGEIDLGELLAKKQELPDKTFGEWLDQKLEDTKEAKLQRYAEVFREAGVSLDDFG